MLADACQPCTVILSRGGHPGDCKHDVATTPGQVYMTCVAVECVPVMPQHLLVLYGDNADSFDNALKMQRSYVTIAFPVYVVWLLLASNADACISCVLVTDASYLYNYCPHHICP